MKKIIFALITFTLLGVSAAISQTKDISGTVTNEKNENIIGAVITVKGTTLSAVTDDNGVFNLKSVPDTSTIMVSAAGYQEAEVKVADKTNFSIVLVKTAAKDNAMTPYRYPRMQPAFIKTR